MEIRNFQRYRDGGTVEISTDKGIFCFDERISSNTKGRLYNGYPKDDNSNLIENYSELEKELIEGLKLYKNDFYQKSIDNLIKSKSTNNKNDIISAFAYSTGSAIENLIKEHTNNLENTNKMLEAKILQWYQYTKDEKFAKFFEITNTKNGLI